MYEIPVFCTQCGLRLAEKPIGPAAKLVPWCPACGTVHWIDPKVAAGCLIVRDGRVLLVKRGIEPGYGTWVFPGGHVDRGETVEEAALQHAVEPGEDAGERRAERLSVAHHAEVVARLEVEEAEHGLEHLRVLAGRDREDVRPSVREERRDHRRELDRLGSRPEQHGDGGAHHRGGSAPVAA